MRYAICASGSASIKCRRSAAEPAAKCVPSFCVAGLAEEEKCRPAASSAEGQPTSPISGPPSGLGNAFPFVCKTRPLYHSRRRATPESFLYRRVGRLRTPPVQCVGELLKALCQSARLATERSCRSIQQARCQKENGDRQTRRSRVSTLARRGRVGQARKSPADEERRPQADKMRALTPESRQDAGSAFADAAPRVLSSEGGEPI